MIWIKEQYKPNFPSYLETKCKLKIQFTLNQCASSKSHIFLISLLILSGSNRNNQIQPSISSNIFLCIHKTPDSYNNYDKLIIQKKKKLTMANVKGRWDFHSQETQSVPSRLFAASRESPNRSNYHTHTHL